MNTSEFDKYHYYKHSVQTPDVEAEFLTKTFSKIRGYLPEKCREDFCGTFAVSCELVKLNPQITAFGVDFDTEPLSYGERENLSLLTKDQQKRVIIEKCDVLTGNLPQSQLVCALNFSYFIFKDRQILNNYFQKVYDSLDDDGVFIMDCFGGSECYEENEEETEHEDEGFSYFWDQASYNPINNHAQFYIHFQREGEEKREKVFSYDWRLWSIPEIREILHEVGFKDTQVYWEGTDEDGEGDGVYTQTEQGEDCESWVAYIVGSK